MERRHATLITRRTGAPLALLAIAGLMAGGCLGEPEVEDRWTRLDIESASVQPFQSLPSGSSTSITVGTAITYRRIITGFAVAELRGSATLNGTQVELHPEGDRVRMADDVDRVLANSVTLGRATRAITGWDHLIQRIDFTFDGVAAAALDTSGTTAGLFLVVYLGQGDEVERQDGTDTLIVTPFPSVPNELLPVGMELAVGP
ncbi:MAG: hypothetical protein HOP12_15620 [Candidatus Eisenbacteria bacterium]|uniref:Uncharacterized protein n=1 Tax=Eiseniibacteriota bacterium TaxID=2212470 RepID=A0A849SP55_UNCEI|nr:hypothetical protein [Candidatus Eisenbacteria bacterium]